MLILGYIEVKEMPIVRCDVKDCGYQGCEVCKADRIKIVNGECKTCKTFEEIMQERSEIDYSKCRGRR